MVGQDKSRYSKFLKISAFSLITLNVLLAILTLPILFSSNENLSAFLFLLQRTALLPLTSFVLILWLINYWTNVAKNKQKVPSKDAEKKENNLMGRLIALGIGAILLLIYLVYEAFSKQYSKPYMSDTMFILMIVVIVLAIILGPFVGQIYKKIKAK